MVSKIAPQKIFKLEIPFHSWKSTMAAQKHKKIVFEHLLTQNETNEGSQLA